MLHRAYPILLTHSTFINQTVTSNKFELNDPMLIFYIIMCFYVKVGRLAEHKRREEQSEECGMRSVQKKYMRKRCKQSIEDLRPWQPSNGGTKNKNNTSAFYISKNVRISLIKRSYAGCFLLVKELK